MPPPKKSLIQPATVDLGDKLKVIPGAEPDLQLPGKGFSTEKGKVIPVCEPFLNGNETKYVEQCLRTNWISSAGQFIVDFEREFARVCGAQFGIATTSGTTALHLALTIMGVGPGDEVIIPTFTMIASANTVRHAGAWPVLVDSESKTWNMDSTKIEEKINRNTKAIMVMHTSGHPCDMDPIQALADKYNLFVLEDAAEAHGAEYRGRKIGSLGDAACFSFYANKIITTGEGGMITTNSKEFYEKASNLRDHSFSCERHFWHKYVAFNFRMTNMAAAVGLAQVEQFNNLVDRRISHAQQYSSILKEVKGLTLPPVTEGVKNVFWMYGVVVEDEFGISRDELRHRLAQLGIETRTFFIPIHLQPIYHNHFKGQEFPVAEELCLRGLYLPSAGGLTNDEIEFVCQAVKKCRG
ncbi:MAG: DegT/DnrJ/EryC1/StrS family aminotransferase [Nitrospinota bacterium]|nr:DegT/DnrJ/EryC1/StrS family aminotransferase [Nitrospinota bacterium]